MEQRPEDIEGCRQRIQHLRRTLNEYFVAKGELIDLMILATLAQEPLLFVGRPGTAKSDLVLKFCQALSLKDDEYFEYMLTKFTEPSEIVGPIDINELKQGRYLRRTEGKLPTARVVFLDEIFKSNSAILNTLLTIINERKFYQEGRPIPVAMEVLFAATNEIPELAELDALKDRFVLKCESLSVRDDAFESLIDKGLRNEVLRTAGQEPWRDLCKLEDFTTLKRYFDQNVANNIRSELHGDRNRYFPPEIFSLFRRIIRTLEREDRVEISDRTVVKLYKLLRLKAFLEHGGTVQRQDLTLLRYLARRNLDLATVHNKVDRLLALG